MFVLKTTLLWLENRERINIYGNPHFQSILPTPERVMLFQYLYGQPVQMTVYGHSLTYGTIGKQLFQYLYGQPVQMTVYGHSLTYGTIGKQLFQNCLRSTCSDDSLRSLSDLWYNR